jgi:hypothetical protein
MGPGAKVHGRTPQSIDRIARETSPMGHPPGGNLAGYRSPTDGQ